MSKPTPKFKFKITNGKIVWKDKDTFSTYIKAHFKNDQEGRASFTRYYKTRTTGQEGKGNQNGYLHAVVIPILCDHTGHSPDEIKFILKLKFWRKGGTDDMPIVGSTAKTDRVDWEDIMERIRIWALTDLDCTIPLPNEVDY